MNIYITKREYEELAKLKEGETLDVTFNGLDGYLTPDEYGEIEYKDRRYSFNFYHPTEVKLHVKRGE